MISQYAISVSRSISYRDPVPLTPSQKRTLRNVENKDHEYESSMKKAAVYIIEHPIVIWEVAAPEPKALYYGTKAGVTAGAIIGSAAGPTGIITGSIAGGAVGFVSIWGYVSELKRQQIVNSAAYFSWSSARQLILKHEAILTFFHEDSILQYFRCPISGHLPEIPVRFQRSKITFDLTAFTNWQKENPGKIYPGNEYVPAYAVLEFDHAHTLTILDRLNEIFVYAIGEVSPRVIGQYHTLVGCFNNEEGVNHGDVVTIIANYLDDDLHTNCILQELNKKICDTTTLIVEELKKSDITNYNTRKKLVPINSDINEIRSFFLMPLTYELRDCKDQKERYFPNHKKNIVGFFNEWWKKQSDEMFSILGFRS